MDGRHTGKGRTKQVAKGRPLGYKDWTTERVQAWKAKRRLLGALLQLWYPRSG